MSSAQNLARANCALTGQHIIMTTCTKLWVKSESLVILLTMGLWAAAPDARMADAMQNQDKTLVRSLLRQHADVNGTGPDRTTALMWAAHWGDLETVGLLLRAGADFKATNRYGTSALSEAAETGDVAILGQLLNAGADPNTVSQNNETVLMTVSHIGNVEAVKLLLDHGADVNARNYTEQETALMYAVNEGHVPVARLLISKGADVNAVAHTSDTPRRLTRAFPAERITGGFTALMFAARQGEMECARALLEAGADTRIADRDGMTPMIIAAMNGHFETAALILEKGGDPNDGTLWETLEFRNLRRAESVARPEPAMTSKLDSLAFAKMLLDRGANPTKPYGKVRTNRGVRGTQLFAPTGSSALERATQAVDTAAMRMMFDHTVAAGIELDSNAILAATVQASAVIGPGKLLFRTVTVKDIADAVALCLQHGADVNAANAAGNTPLHVAAQRGADDVIRILAERGAKLDLKNKAGLTPLDLAVGKKDAVGLDSGAVAAPEAHQSTAVLLRQLMVSGSARNTASENQ
jgi:ankyrin repeat protein